MSLVIYSLESPVDYHGTGEVLMRAGRNQNSGNLAALVGKIFDGEIDTLFTSLFRELLTYMMEDPRSIGFCTHLLFCAKNLERVGDHATNIAETAHYVISGEALVAERPKGDESIAIESLRPPQT